MTEKLDPKKFGEGYSKFEKYLTGELYKNLDSFIGDIQGKIPKDNYKEIKKYNDGYKSSFSNGMKEMKKPLDEIKNLLESAENIRSEGDAKKLQEAIGKQYNVIFQLAAQFYQLLDPEIDVSNLIEKLYKDVNREIFRDGCKILKDYFIEDSMIGKIRNPPRK